MVDAGDVGAEVLFALFVALQPEGGQQALGADLDRVAETDRLHAAAAEHRTGEHRHRIGVVEEPGVRRDLFDVAGEVEHHRNRPQCAEDAADAERVGDGLAQAVFLGNLEVDDGRRLIPADLDGVDDEVRVAERRFAGADAEVGGDRRPVVVDVGIQRLEDEFRLFEPFAVDVVQREVGILQRFAAHAVADDVAGEYRAACSHECDFRHLSFLRILCDVSAGAGDPLSPLLPVASIQ